jgi:ligand-binding sensor domain-containing protein/signal transduction histidine kinase
MFTASPCCSFAALVQTAPVSYEQHTWTHENGLPDDRIKAILQTQDGYLWVGSPRGLARFDGQRFVLFNHLNTPEFVSDDCVSLVEDSAGSLWVATTKALYRKTGNQFNKISKEQGLGGDKGLGLYAGASGAVWAYRDYWFSIITQEKIRSYYCNKRAPYEFILGTLEDSPGVVWMGTTGGLLRYQAEQDRFLAWDSKQDFLSFPAIRLWQNKNGERWVLFTSGVLQSALKPDDKFWLSCFNDRQWTHTAHLSADELCWRGIFLTGDSSGAMWLPAKTNGLLRFFQGESLFLPMPHLVNLDYALCACSDRQGDLWVGTEASGLQRWTPRKMLTYSKRDGLADDNTWTICEKRDGSVLIGTDGGVSHINNGRVISAGAPTNPAPGFVRSIVEDREGTLWVGTMRNLLRNHAGQDSEFKLPGNWDESKIRVLLAGRDGTLWIGTVHGLTHEQNGSLIKYTKAEGLGANEVRALVEDKEGDLWIGTYGGGLSRLQGNRFITLTTTNGLPSNNVWALYEDAEGTLWIGTDNGLSRRKQGHLTTFTSAQGLPNNQINCMAEDSFGRLWIGWDHGIFWVSKQQLEEVACRRATIISAVSYDETDGLPTTETNGQKSNPAACKTHDGRLWFPTTRGVVVIDPTQVIDDEVAPLTVIEQVRANGEVIFGNTPSEVKASRGKIGVMGAPAVLNLLPGGGRVLEFRYTANNLLAPEKTKFRYRLFGLDNHWIEAENRREAYFSNLRPGDYQFEVIASGHHGVWPAHGALVAFHLGAFYYETWQFYLGCIGLVSAVGIYLVTWRVGELRKIHQLEQVSALSEQRRQIARDIHDELGASLTHIVQISEETRKNVGRPERIEAHAHRIASIAGEAIENIGEIAWANNPDYDTLEDLTAYLREYVASAFRDTSVELNLDFPHILPGKSVSGLFRRHMLLIVKEALQNVMKHAGATVVRVELSLLPNGLKLLVSDDGRGFDTGRSYPVGNGMANMEDRVRQLHGSLKINSHLRKGTELHVFVPLL